MMKSILMFLIIGSTSISLAEYIEGVDSTEDAVKSILNRQCGDAGEFIEEIEIDSDYDYGIYRVDFTNGWASVTVSKKQFPVEPWNEYDYFVDEYACTKVEPIDSNSIPGELEWYLDDFFASNCDLELEYEKVSVNKTLETSGSTDNIHFSFSKIYDVFYENKAIGEANVYGVMKDDEDPVSEWDFSISCPI